MKKLLILLCAALVSAAALGAHWQPMPLEERVVRLRAVETFPWLDQEPVEMQALFLDYADDPLLILKARAALLRYPQQARRILPLYGPEAEFRDILRSHGEHILPPIDYFLSNEIHSLNLRLQAAARYRHAKEALGRWWSAGQSTLETAGDEAGQATAQNPETDAALRLTPEQRGWYAVNFIRDEGYDFLGQFVMDPQGRARWIQSERALEGVNYLFVSGIRSLETRLQTGQDVSAGDIGWAAVDVVAIVGATHLLRLGKAASSTARASKPVSGAGRSAAFGARLRAAGQVGLQGTRYAKWPAIGLGVYLAARHPSLINDLLAGVAEVVGLPAWVVQLSGWTLILLPLFWAVSWIARWLIRPTIAALSLLIRGLRRLERKPPLADA